MFEKWFAAFADDGSNGVTVTTLVTTGDNGTPADKDIGYLLNKVITANNELRIVISV